MASYQIIHANDKLSYLKKKQKNVRITKTRMSKRSKELMMESVTYLNPSRTHMRIAVKNQVL